MAVRDTVNLKTFAAWVQAECGISVRAAQLYIRSADVFGDCEIISQIAPTTVMKLAAPSVPQEVRDDLVRRLEAGERIRTTDVEEVIRISRKASEPDSCEWDTAREVALAKAAVERKRRKAEQAIDGDLALADFYAAWAAVPEMRRAEALLEIHAVAYLNTTVQA